ncbi:MAG: SDR family oxidoreductase [Bacteroidales bacterium]|nr:SDR family oxidoreductase [Bacteroidales bacterium]
MYNPYSLEGKTILITGASSGIGRATAIECSKLGARCIITARNQERLQQTLNQLEGDGHIQIFADLTKKDELENLINQTPKIDGLVNSAGIVYSKPITFIKQDDLDKIFSINTYAPIILTKSLIKQKKINKRGSIVIISSIASDTQTPGNTIYGMAKSALACFTRYCALELAQNKIRVNSIHPGMINTEMTANICISKEEIEIDKNTYPLKRYGEPQEIAWAIIYLLSDASSFVTGSKLTIDGGKSLI